MLFHCHITTYFVMMITIKTVEIPDVCWFEDQFNFSERCVTLHQINVDYDLYNS
jgi:hypothetical protein